MRLARTIAAAASFAVAAPAVAQTTINFDDGTQGAAIGAFYAARGVTFGNAAWDGFVSPGETTVGAGGLKFIAINGTYQPKVGNPIVAFFSFALSSASVRGLNVGANGARIDAYDALVGGTRVSFAEAFGVDVGADNAPLLSVTGAGIRRIEFYQPASTITEGMLWDNLTFTASAVTTTPEPATVALVGAGAVLLLGWSARRRGQPAMRTNA